MYDILELNKKLVNDLRKIAKDLGIKKVEVIKKQDLIYQILDQQAITKTSKVENSTKKERPRKIIKKPVVKTKIEDTDKKKPVKPVKIVDKKDDTPSKPIVKEVENKTNPQKTIVKKVENNNNLSKTTVRDTKKDDKPSKYKGKDDRHKKEHSENKEYQSKRPYKKPRESVYNFDGIISGSVF